MKQLLNLLLVYDFVIALSSCFDSGYPLGLMADCPGMNRTTSLSVKTRDSLSVVVHWPSSGVFGGSERRCSLSAKGADCAARLLNFRRRTKVIISGYLESSSSPFVRSSASMELQRGRNVIALEVFPVLWKSYPIAARLTKPLGLMVGEFLARLSHRGLSAARLELLGGSLGAHIAYHAAVRFKQLTGREPARLTGLDPAGPCFRHVPAAQRFNAGAARRVDVLHTNIDGMGIAEPLGHVDFYANGGEFQPAMAGNFILPCFLLCSHARAAAYWSAANQHPTQFVGVQCASVARARRADCYGPGPPVTNVLGPKTNFTARGIFYLPTNDGAPFYRGEKGLHKRRYDANNYLLKACPDDDLVV